MGKGKHFERRYLKMKRHENGRRILSTEVTKMQKGCKKIGLALVAVGLSLTLLLTGAIPVCEAGPDQKVVKAGIITAFTGALATSAAPAGRGWLD